MTTTVTKQTLLQAVESTGWHLNNDFLDDLVQEKPNLNSNDLVKIALNTDLKTMGRKFIPDGIMIGKAETFEGPGVVQVVKVRNVAAPKENEHSTSAPPFYKVTVTDGTVNCNALVMDDIPNLSLETAPGTKLLLKGSVKVKSSSLMLTSQTCQVLGGTVEHLFTKWKANKDLTNHVRTGNEGAAPVWVPFGSVQKNTVDTSKKTLQVNEVQEDASSEFSQQRLAALAEANEARGKVNKTFIHQTVEKPAQQPQQESTVQADTQTAITSSRQFSAPSTTSHRGGKGGRFRNRNKDDEDAEVNYKDTGSSKAPSKTATLFDFITKKTSKLNIKDNDEDEIEEKQHQSSLTSTDNNNNTTKPKSDYYQGNSSYNQGNNGSSSQYNNSQRTSNGPRSTYNNDYNSSYNNKDKKSNLPPRLQRANDEKERYSNSSSSYNQQQQRRSGGTNASPPNEAPQKATPTTTLTPTPTPTTTTTTTITKETTDNQVDNNTKNDMNNYEASNNNEYYNNGNYGNSQYYNNKKNLNKNKYNNNYRSNNGDYNNYHHQPKSYYNSNYSNNYNNKQQQQYYAPQQVSAANATGTAITTASAGPSPYMPIYFDPHHAAQFASPYYNQGYAAAYPAYDATNGTPYYVAAPIPIPISTAALAGAPPQLITTVAPVHVQHAPPPQQQHHQVEQASQYQQSEHQTDNSAAINKNNAQTWKKGDQCLALYYDDNKYYAAVIKSLKNNKAYVEYTGYDESDEVQLSDLKPYYDNNRQQSTRTNHK